MEKQQLRVSTISAILTIKYSFAEDCNFIKKYVNKIILKKKDISGKFSHHNVKDNNG